MAVEVKLPRLGQGMESGTIVRWLKSEGEEVAKGEALYELDTDKVTQEVEADAAGVLLKIVVADGEVDVGTTVALIGAQGEDVSTLLGNGQPEDGAAPPAPAADAAPAEAAQPSSPQPEPTVERATSAEPRETSAPTAAPETSAPRGADERVKASPLARRIARERGVDLAVVTGTGPEGRVIANDVEQAAVATTAAQPPAEAEPAPAPVPAEPAAAEAPPPEAPATEPAPAEPAAVAEPEEAPTEPEVPAEAEAEIVELTSTRRTIARRLTEAWQAPVFQLTVTADASELVATRETMVELLREGDAKPTVSDVLTRIAASALVRHPGVNAHFVEGKIHRFPRANVGIAVAAPTGLVVPVIRDANQKSVQQIAADRADLVTRARDGKLQLADLEGGTFTISNLGMYGIEQFVAVLNPPQVAILAVGSIEDRPRASEGELVVKPTITMTLTCDHRAIDGSEGAEFLRAVKTFVESPALAL